MLKDPFKNIIQKNKQKRELYVFTLFSLIFCSSIIIYNYIKYPPAILSKYPQIKIVTKGQLNYEEYTNCSFELESEDQSEKVDTINTKIKLSGVGNKWNSFSPKKGYRIELSEPKSLLGMCEDDDWLLFSMYYDFPRMRIKLSLDLWNNLQPPTPTTNLPCSEYVILYLDGEFLGLYLLAEKNNRRLYGLDEAQNNINSSFIFQTKNPTTLETYERKAWEQDWPNDYEGIIIIDNVLPELIGFISNSSENEFLNELNGIFSKFDKANLIDFYIFNFFIYHKDFWDKNYFIIRNSAPNKFFLIPWDFDYAFGQFGWIRYDADTNQELKIRNQNFLFNRLLESKEFLQTLKFRWIELRENVLSEEYILNMVSEYYEEIKEILKIDTDMWNPSKYEKSWENDVNESVKDFYQWIADRLIFCDDYFNF